MANYTIARLANQVQAPQGSGTNVHQVPANTTHVIKAIYMNNGRTDSTAITYSIYLVPSGGSVGSTTLFIANKTIAVGEMQAFEFSTLILNAGDAIWVSNNTASGLYYQAHGMIVQ